MRRPRIGCKRNEKALYQLANYYRKGGQQKIFNIKAQGSDEVLTEPHEIKECWTNYFSSLMNVQQHQEELTTMSEPTADVEYQHITEHGEESAVKRSKNGKAPGCDIIPNEVYKAGVHVCMYVYIYSSDMDIQKLYSDNENNYIFC